MARAGSGPTAGGGTSEGAGLYSRPGSDPGSGVAEIVSEAGLGLILPLKMAGPQREFR